MNYIVDTNIVLLYMRRNKKMIDKGDHLQFFKEENTTILSVVSVGEIESIALKNNWGDKRKVFLKLLLSKFTIARINATPIIKKYAEIDAYSQNKLPNKPLNDSSRNMGKNDLWIAATASVLNAKLITTDKDFSHLKDEYFDIEFVEI